MNNPEVIRNGSGYTFNIYPSGRTLFVAIDTGLLDGDQSADENDLFRTFWGHFVSLLEADKAGDYIRYLDISPVSAKEPAKEFNDPHKVLDKERPQDGHKGGQEHKPDLKAVLGLLIGGVLGTFFTALGFALFVL